MPSAGAWVDISTTPNSQATAYEITTLASAGMGRYTGTDTYNNCSNWTALSWNNGTPADTLGLTITPSGTQSQVCKVARPVACCF